VKFRIVTLLGFEIGLLVVALGAIGMFAHVHWSLEATNSSIFVRQTLIPIFCLVVSFYYNDLYDLRTVRSFSDFCALVPQALGVAFILLAAISTIFPSVRVEGMSSASTVGALLFTLSLVFPIRAIGYSLLRSQTFAERVLILGTSPLAQKIVAEVGAASYPGYAILGYVDDRSLASETPESLPAYPLLGSLDHLESILAELNPDRIIVALTERRGRLPVRDLLHARMSGILIEDGVEVLERFTGKLAIESLNPSSLFFSKDFTISQFEMILRRLVSLTVSLSGVLLTAPLMILIALAIKLESKGSIFFIQTRAGLHGVPFQLVKFRTMRPLESGSEAEKSVWRRDSASRVTRVGKVLRKLRLDELPQFINILRGDMDLVGPRPEMVNNVKTMTEQIPYYSLRMGVRPGLTGWAQVKHGYSVSQEDVTEKMRYDLYYLKHMSLWFDIKILLDTVKIIFSGQGSEQTLHTGSDPQAGTANTETSVVNFVASDNSQERRRVWD
jgi:exopolysaccharide biosynthesis polyprenyl glycosylphosphotransferase